MKMFTPCSGRRRLYGTILIFCVLSLAALIQLKAQAPLEARFSADTTSGCSPVIVSFTDQSSGHPTGWKWDFGNGNKSTLQNPQTVFYKPGSYTVTLSVTDADHQEKTVTREAFITVSDTPHVDFLAGPTSGCYPLRVNFKDGSSPGSGSISSWLWDFGDGAVSHQPNPAHVFNRAAAFNITLSVTNSKGCSSAITNPSTIITKEAVKADFSADRTFACATPMQVHFKAQSNNKEKVTYRWDFGDGATGSGADPVHLFTKKGDYTIRLIAASVEGCSDTIVKKSYIHAGTYKTDFVLPQGCAGTDLTFKNTSSPKPDSSRWSFGDGSYANTYNATHPYKNSGTYSLRLINFYGECRDTLTRSLTTFPSPEANFKTDREAFCGTPVSVSFQDQSKNATSWYWNFGDGKTSSKKNPVNSYKKEGLFDVKLMVKNKQGCTDSVVKKNYIHISAPTIAFKASETGGCIGMKVSFQNQVKSMEPITGYYWSFGDSIYSTSPNPNHTYAKEGAYTVKLKVITASGCSDSLVKKAYIRVGSIPKVDFSATPQSACLGTAVQFTNQSQPGGDTWEWQFPNDGNATETTENPLRHFHNLGPQDVTLTVDNNGCKETVTKTDFITILPPKARFSKLQNCANRYEVRFTDKSEGATGWHWDFGDHTTSDNQKPTSHYYEHTGKYKVTLTVTNGSCSSKYSQTLYIIDEKPDLETDQHLICRGSTVTLSANNITDYSLIKSYTWITGDGRTLRSTQKDLKTAYKKNGTFGVRLVTTDLNGCKDTSNMDSILVRGPLAGFSVSSAEACPGMEVSFTDQSVGPGSPLQRWIWNYGDGNADTLTKKSAIHQYHNGGKFRVQLTVMDQNGCSDTKSITNAVSIYGAKADFTTPDTLICPGAPIHWKNNSSGNGLQYAWDFGDGTIASRKTPSKTFLQEGLYSISLRVQTKEGCTDSTTKTAYIRAAEPHAKLHYSDNQASCPPFVASAINQSSHYTKVEWDFGDGATAVGKDTVKHVYNIPGNYRFKMRIYGYSGCMDSIVRNVFVEGPYGKGTVTDTIGCGPHRVSFSGTAVNTESFRWDFGDGVISGASTNNTTNHLYKEAGIFKPKLILTDSRNCTVAIPLKKSVTIDGIFSKPAFSIPEICDSGYYKFNTAGGIFSTDTLGMTASYLWDFGDPGSAKNTSNEIKTDHHYSHPGRYWATLKIETPLGCFSRDTIRVHVPVPEKIKVTQSSDTSICIGESVPLHASGGYKYNWFPAAGLNDPQTPNPIAKPEKTTAYQVIAHNQNGCIADTGKVVISVHDKPVIRLASDTTIPTGSSLRLRASTSEHISNWSWSPSDFLSCTHCANPVTTPRRPITYRVVATNNHGCISTDNIRIFLICAKGNVFVPNTFTPNGDGMNDVFYPRGKGVKEVVYFRIYNRWGQLLYERTHFQVNDRSAGWKGTFKGKVLDPGVFVFESSMVCDDGKVFQINGNVTLVR